MVDFRLILPDPHHICAICAQPLPTQQVLANIEMFGNRDIEEEEEGEGEEGGKGRRGRGTRKRKRRRIRGGGRRRERRRNY